MQKELTLILTNYKRPGNVADQVRKYRAFDFIDLCVVDNSGTFPDMEGCTVYRHENELACWQRWEYAKKANTRLVATLDDDLTVNIEDAILKSYWGLTGIFGVVLDEKKDYWQSKHFKNKSMKVDIVKGRFMILPQSFTHFIKGSDNLNDDICVSSFFEGLCKIQPIPYKDYERDLEGLESQIEHHKRRQDAVNRWFR